MALYISLRIKSISKSIILFLFLIFLCSCSKRYSLNNNEFLCLDLIRTHSLKFINDSICIYDQEFLCEMKQPYDFYRVNCKYFIEGNKIILKNLSEHPDSSVQTCFEIPDRAFDNCKPIIDEIKEESEIFRIPPKATLLIDVFRYYNNITTDTLTYKRRRIKYVKKVDCAPFMMVMGCEFKRVTRK
jgi:hypothetical protein